MFYKISSHALTHTFVNTHTEQQNKCYYIVEVAEQLVLVLHTSTFNVHCMYMYIHVHVQCMYMYLSYQPNHMHGRAHLYYECT